MGLKKHAENSSFLMLVNRIRRFVKHRTYNEYIWSYIFLAPAMAAFVVFLVYPAINTIIFSFQNFSIFNLEHPFVGLRNYQSLFKDRIWWIAVRNTIVFTLATVPFKVLVPMLIALALMRLNSTLQTGFKTVFYMPAVTSAVVIGLVWLWIYYPFQEGVGKRLGDFSRLAPTELVGLQQDSFACDYFYGMDDRPRSCHYPLHGGAGRGAALIL